MTFVRSAGILGFFFGAAFAVSSSACAQTPEVAIFADLRPTWFVETGNENRVRWYDMHGNYSVVGFHMVLESGNIVFVTQRLEKINNDGDPDSLDEAYIESRGLWRIGKQYLPFGQQSLLRESAPALRYDTQLLFDAIPVSIAVSDNREGLTRGIVARVGGDLGVSVATGDHFGIQGSSLTQVQRPVDAPGRGRGYKRALGLDTKYGWRGGVIEAEWVMLFDGKTALDDEKSVSDLRYRFATKGTGFVVTLGWSRAWNEHQDFYHAAAEIPVGDKIVWEPFVRLEGLDWRDFGLSARIRL